MVQEGTNQTIKIEESKEEV